MKPNSMARKPPKRSGWTVLGKFFSDKCGEIVITEGSIERDYVRLLEFDPQVLWYQVQPFAIHYREWPNGVVKLAPEEAQEDDDPPGWRMRKYYPDFLVKRAGGLPFLLVEVKNSQELNKEHVQRKLIAGHLWAVSKGWEFRIVTEEIREGPLLASIRTLQRYRRLSVPPALIDKVVALRAAIADQQTSVRHFASFISRLGYDPDQSLAFTYALILQGVLIPRLNDRPIGTETLVSIASGGVRFGFGAASVGRAVLV